MLFGVQFITHKVIFLRIAIIYVYLFIVSGYYDLHCLYFETAGLILICF